MSKKKFVVVLLSLALLLTGCDFRAEKSELVINLEAGQQQTIVAYGTSLTQHGAWVGQLRYALDHSYPGQTMVINSGEGGMESTWGLENLSERVIDKKPDMVLIEFAINDAFFPYKISVEEAQNNLENMIDNILRSNPDCEIVLMVMNPPTGKHLEKRPRITEYYQIYREVAKDQKLLLIDHYPNWEKILDEDRALFDFYIPDGLHPGVEGANNVITPEILKSLGIESEVEADQIPRGTDGK